MVRAGHFFMYRHRALKERPRPRKVALVVKQKGEVVEARRRVGMLGAEHLLAYRQRAFQERPCPRMVTLGMEQLAETVEALRCSGMFGAERLFADGQCITKEGPQSPPRPVSLGCARASTGPDTL